MCEAQIAELSRLVNYLQMIQMSKVLGATH